MPTVEELRQRAYAIRIRIKAYDEQPEPSEYYFRKFGRRGQKPVFGTPWLSWAKLYAFPEGDESSLDCAVAKLSEMGVKPVVVEVCCAC